MKKYSTSAHHLFNQIAAPYDRLNRLLSLGVDRLWREKLVKKLPHAKNLVVIDVATGTAELALALAKDSRVKKVVGIDLSPEMLKVGEKKCETRLAKNPQEGEKITLQLADALELPFERESFDVAAMSFGLRNFADPKKALDEMYRVLKPGGQILFLEFSLPQNSALKSLYLFYFRKLLPQIGNFFSRHPDAYSYLNQSVEDFKSPEEILTLMSAAGFQEVHSQFMTKGIVVLYGGVKSVS